VPGQDVDVTVTIRDEDGNTVAGVLCSFNIVSQPGTDASLGIALVTTDAGGQATTTLHGGSTSGTIQVQAHCGAVTLNANVEVATSPPESLPGTGTGALSAGAAGARGLELLLLGLLLGLIGLGAAHSVQRRHRNA
jgi:hypothetical protein